MASADKDKLGADLSAYLDGELSPKRAREVEQLLAESEEARQTLADLRAISEGLAELPRMSAPAGLAERVSRGSERQVLLQDRRPAQRMRVLKLFGRISASAALIVACVIAGWTVVQRINQPGATGGDVALTRGEQPTPGDAGAKAAPPRLAAKGARDSEIERVDVSQVYEDAPAVAMKESMRRLEALGYVGESESDVAGAAPAEEGGLLNVEVPPALAKAVPKRNEVTESASRQLVFGAESTAEAAPAVSVVITPRDAEEFNAALQALESWQQPIRAGRLVTGGRIAGSGDEQTRGGEALGETAVEYAHSPPAPRDFNFEIPESRFYAFLSSLDEQAPGQVQAAMNFNARDITQVQRMVMSTEAVGPDSTTTPAKGDEDSLESQGAFARADFSAPEDGAGLAEDDALRARRRGGRGGERGLVTRDQEPPKGPRRAKAEEAAKSRLVDAHPVPEALDVNALESPRALGYAGRPEKEERSRGPAADKKAALDSQRHPRVEDVAAKVPTIPASPMGDGKLGLASLGEPVEMTTEPSSAKPTQPQPAAVTLRVTLLPPPSSQPVGRPTSGPSSSSGEEP